MKAIKLIPIRANRIIMILSVLFLLIMLNSCTKPEKITTKISIIKDDFYLGIRLESQSEIKQGAEKVAEWETFTLEKVVENQYRIKAFNDKYVKIDPESNLLLANGNGDSSSEIFIFRPINVTSKTQILTLDSIPIILNNNLLTVGLRNSTPTTFGIVKLRQSYWTFNLQQTLFLGSGIVFILLSMYFFEKRTNKVTLNWSIILLIVGSILFRIFAILLDDHLNTWDEQFHALVSKNLILHPLKPTLLNQGLLVSDFKTWVHTHIWLHKQPLFMWQMAGFMKLFGVNLVALRLHMVLMSAIIVALIFRMGSILISKKIGFYAAILFLFSNFAIEQVSGYYHTDHNDVTFLFYITLSFWSWMEYETASNKKYKLYFLVLIGLFSGAAILTKWLVGLIVFLSWGVAILANPIKRNKVNSYLHLFFSLIISFLISLPWQWYIAAKYPEQSRWENALNKKHFFSVVENHSGDWTYHFSNSELLYGIPTMVLLIGLIVLTIKVKEFSFKWSIPITIIFIYLFFTIASTKMPAFVFILAPFIYISVANLYWSLVDNKWLKKLIFKLPIKIKLLQGIGITFLFLHFMNLNEIKEIHTSWQKNFEGKWQTEQEMNYFVQNLNLHIPHIEEYVLFNLYNYKNIKAMFHTNAVEAYGHIPSKADITIILNAGYKVAVYDDGNLPDFILNDKEIKLFKKEKTIVPTIFPLD